MCSAHCLIMLYISVKFHENISNGFQLTEQTRVLVHGRNGYIFNIQRAVIPELRNPKLWFLHSAHRLIVLYICVKFRENTSNGIRVI